MSRVIEEDVTAGTADLLEEFVDIIYITDMVVIAK